MQEFLKLPTKDHKKIIVNSSIGIGVRNLKDLKNFEKAIADGYHVAGDVFSIGNIQRNHKEFLDTRNPASSVDAFMKTFDLRMDKRRLLDPANKNKSIIILEKKSSPAIGIVTSDSQCIKRANQQLAYQNECVGILISANCYVSGSSSEPDLIPHLNKVIPQLNGLQGWSFKQTEATEFEVSKKLSSTNEKEAEQELDRVRVLLNYVAITRKVGIRVVRYSIAKTPRFGPSHGITGPPEWMMPPLSKAETGRSAKFVSLSPEIHKIADGLNQVYLLTSLNSRLSLLWAIMEAVFIDKPEPLLSDDEIESVISSAMRIPTLEGDARLNVLENALKDPNRIPKKSRNRRISENIAIALNLNADDLYQEIKNTSKVRGEYLHELKTDIQEMRQAEKFLRTILERHLEANMK